jgi:hypothetical protein
MVDNNENVLVEFDYQNIVLVDPNKIIDSEGNVKERLLKHENLVYYANLECNLFPRTRLSVGNNGYYENKTVSIAAINFLKPGNKTFLDNGYLDEITGFNSVQGKGANQIIETNNQIVKSDKSTESYQTQSISNNIDNNLLLISDISINTPLNLTPTVTIKMEDIRGRALFEQGENSPYSVFFNYPYPLFYLTVKGYLGKAVKYQLALKTFNARFDTASGNFKIECVFMAYKYNVLTNVSMEQVKAIPYMYRTKYTLSPVGDASSQSAQNQVGNTTKDVAMKSTSRGYEKMKEVYSEYKSKGLIPEDFPEMTLQELVVKLEVLEKTITDSLSKADMAPITDGENYQNNLTEYEKEVYFARGNSWFYKYMNTTEFFIDKATGLKMYTFNKETIEGKKKLTAITDLSKGLIPKWNKVLADNKTFGNGGKYKVGGEEFNSEIQNKINFLMFTINSSPDQINWDETYRQRTGKEANEVGVTELKTKSYQNVLRSATVDGEDVTFNWYVFEGPGRFVDSMQIMHNKATSKLDEIQEKFSKLLSTRLSDPKSGLGFKPTLKNVIAVLLAGSEAFLRIMCDVHQNAWNQRKNKYRVGAVLSNDKSATSVDAKQSVATTDGNLIPVYPWPQYFIETNNDKGEKFEIAYPGDPKVISKTKGYLYDVWPEVEFVEEFIKGKTVTIVPSADTQSSTSASNLVNRVSLNAIDFPTTNTFFSNKQESKFMYEIWERIFLPANYQRFMRPNAENEILDVIAESEFINISKSLLQDAPFLIEKLKRYGFNSSNYVPFLASISNDGLGESWQKFIRDEFVTTYIQQEVESQFVILDNTVISSGYQNVDPQPTNIDKFKSYLKSNVTNSTNFLDTLPYNMEGWYSQNLANGKTSGSIRDIYNTSKVYVLNEDKKMVANFDSNTTTSDNRPVSSFNYLKPNIPTQDGLGLQSFYSQRAGDDFANTQQVTEGQVNYINYSGNVSAQQTTSMMNTPMFVNSVLQGVDNWLSGNTYPYVNASYLLLNSLPIATLREKYKSYSNGVATDLDYIFAVFKKFGAIHKVPYAWVLKYGSIWHRYKNWVENGVDILDTVWTDFDAASNYDPTVSDPERTYTLTIPGDTTTTDIVLQSVTPVVGGTVTQLNLGFYPKVIDKFNLFYRGYNLFNGYTNADIQTQLDNSTSGFTLTPVSDAIINKYSGYNSSDLTDILSIKPWNCTLLDKRNKLEYIVPSFGSTINQINSECFDNSDKLLLSITSNPAIFNGSVRSFWALPNYGYFDLFEVDKPQPTQHLKTILSGSPDQLAFTLGKYSAYTSNEEMFSVFNREILDMLENEFLKFSKSMYEYETKQVGDLVTTRVQIDKLYLDPNGINKNFQLLLKDMMSVNIVTPSSTSSSNQTNTLKKEQFIKVNNTIKNFLEFDVVLKYGNPGDYNRRLFDSFATNVFIEDKISFNYYVEGSLPKSGVTGTTLSVYKSANPESWKALETYVGFSTEEGVKYTSTGSVVTDFFIDMNVEFIPESVQTLAPLIKIYATQKKLDPTMNRGKFIALLNQYLNDNKKFSDTLLNSVFQKVRFGLPNVDIIPEKPMDTALQGEQTKVELWENFKALNDTWVAGYDYTQTTFLEDVLLLDRGNRNIADEVLIDPFKVRNLLKTINPSASVYFYLESLLDIHHFVCMMHPAYVNYYNVQEVEKNSVPKIEGSLEFGNTLFGTYLNVDTRASSPKLVCIYAAEPSKHLENDKNENNRFKSDSFDLRRSSDNPLTDKLEGKTDWGLSNRVVGFNVDIGIRNQNIFYYFDVSQDSGKQTSESLLQMDNLINQSNGKQTATQNVSLWNFYKSRSYQCRVNMLGNVMIQPTMYFNVRHVPMFNGPYYIMDVNHSISPGRFETTFTGIRQQVFALPKMENYIQTLTKKLFLDLYQQVKQKVNTDAKSNSTANSNPNSVTTTSSTAAPSTNNATVTNTGKVDDSQNCSTKLDPKYNKYVGSNPEQSSLSPKQVIDGINYNISSGDNLDITKMMSFVTIYLESFKDNQFYTFNNNFAGVKLNYDWPGELPKFFTPNKYLCVLSKDGYSYPYAEFSDINNVYKLLGAKWGPVSSLSTMDAESLTESWVRRWNKGTMGIPDFEKFKTDKKTEYDNLIYKVTEAMKLATTLGLLTPPPPPVTINYLGEFDTLQGNDGSYYNLEQNNGKFKVLRIVDSNYNYNNVGSTLFKDSNGDIMTYGCVSGSGSKTCTVNGKNPGTYTMNVEYYPNGQLNSTKIDLVSQPFTQ